MGYTYFQAGINSLTVGLCDECVVYECGTHIIINIAMAMAMTMAWKKNEKKIKRINRKRNMSIALPLLTTYLTTVCV